MQTRKMQVQQGAVTRSEAAHKQEEEEGLDQTSFALDERGFAAFQAMLDAPPAPSEGLVRTLKVRAPWKA